MNMIIPSAEELAARLRAMRLAELQDISKRSGVPYRTLINIRLGSTPNPGLETVRKFFSLLPLPAANDEQAPDTSSQQPAGQGVTSA